MYMQACTVAGVQNYIQSEMSVIHTHDCTMYVYRVFITVCVNFALT